ncbi:hypothetical protein BVRB_7g160480 [Beta vulgaris subsp. vulgaris]|nr:hypothetical protein BVRB_7g160480 [Beta vulgaris subsp. vulgaris]
MEVQNSYGTSLFHLAIVYGLHTIAYRRSLWVELLNFVSHCQGPCNLIGDYNAVYNAQDRMNGNVVSEAKTIDLRNFVMDAQLMEAPSTGLVYSWNNKSLGVDRISSRIDKAFVNCAWIHKYSDVIINYHVVGVSDHTPLVFSVDKNHDKGGRPFKFLNFLVDQHGYIQIVKEVCGSTHNQYKLKNVWVKLHAVK